MPCNAHESAEIIKIYYLSLEYNFPSRNSENLGFPELVKEFKGQGWGFWVLVIKQGPNQPKYWDYVKRFEKFWDYYLFSKNPELNTLNYLKCLKIPYFL
jgi:hypothetical protein